MQDKFSLHCKLIFVAKSVITKKVNQKINSQTILSMYFQISDCKHSLPQSHRHLPQCNVHGCLDYSLCPTVRLLGPQRDLAALQTYAKSKQNKTEFHEYAFTSLFIENVTCNFSFSNYQRQAYGSLLIQINQRTYQ